ncbi:MAG: hypothetical protein ABH950_08160 [Candidatus Altiarchaeota archaeon]
MDVCIKKVDEKAWRRFKAKAAENNLTLGRYFGEIVEKKESRKGTLEHILSREPTLSKKEAEEMKKASENFRKDFKMRF